MSAWIVSREHISLLLKVGLQGPRGRTVSPDTAWHRVSWFADEPEDGWTFEEYGRQRRELRFDNADEIGRMLWTENVRSVAARYPDDTPATRPGPVSDDIDAEAAEFVYRDPRYTPTAVEALLAISCFEYQSCEHGDWRNSEARRFCEALRHALIRALPGMNEAPWGWDADEIEKARARQLGVVELRPRGGSGGASA
jgi:hypothetical protein